MGWRVGIIVGLLEISVLGQAPTWQQTPPPTPTIPGPMAALALGSDSLTLYAGGLGGVWIHLGNNWQATAVSAPVSALAVANGIAYAGTGDINHGASTRAGRGIYSDASGTWRLLGSGAMAGLAVTRIGVDVPNRQHLLAATVTASDSPSGAQPGLYASSDGGASWTRVLPGNVMDFAWSGTAVLAVGATGLELSSDNGADFSALTAAALPATWTRAALAVNPAGGFLALFAGSTPALDAISADGSSVQAQALPPLFAPSASALALAAAGSNIWIGGTDLWEYDTGPKQWTNLTQTAQPGATVSPRQHAVLPAPGGNLWLANDGGVWFRPRSGSLANSNSGLNNAAPTSLALTASGGLWASLAGGGLASAASLPAATWTVADSGETFSAVATDLGGATIYALDQSSGAVLQASDANLTWTSPACPSTPATALASAAGAPWVGDALGNVYASGCNKSRSPTGGNAITALAASGAQVWLADAQALWISTNSDNNWALAATPFTGVSALAVNAAAPDMVAAATPSGVFLTLNHGANWLALSQGLPDAPLTGLAFDSSGTLWAATLGRGLWSLSLAQSAVTLQLAVTPATAPVGTPVRLQATVQQLGQPVADASVAFAASIAGQSGWSDNATTAADGTASVSYTLPSAAGTVSFEAVGDGATASATATAAPGPVARIIVVSGNNQSQVSGTALLQPIVLEVADAQGNGIAGETLTLSGAGAFGATATTDSAGRISVAYTLPSSVGAVTLSAADGAVSTTWTETATVPPNYTLVLTPPSGAVMPNQIVTMSVQVAAIGGYSQPVPLQCLVPIPGCTITPTTVAPGGSATVSVDIGAFNANQTSVSVTVAGDGAHTASAALQIEGFTLSAAAAALSVQAGATTAPLALTVAGVNGFAGTIALAATMSDGTALPAALVPLFSPTSLPISGTTTTASANFTLAAAASGAAVPNPAGKSGPGLAWGLALALGLTVSAVATRCRPQRRIWLVGMAALAAVACGGGGGGGAAVPPPVIPAAPTTATYFIQLTATANGLQQAVPVTLTVSTP